MKLKISKEVVTGLFGVVKTVGPGVGKWVTDKVNNGIEKREQEKKYVNRKHNGIIKYISVLLAIICLISTIVSVNEPKAVSIIFGVLAFITFVITFLFCLEIIHEKRHNIYQVVFFVGVIFLIIHISFY